jgi:hypothetical protein
MLAQASAIERYVARIAQPEGGWEVAKNDEYAAFSMVCEGVLIMQRDGVWIQHRQNVDVCSGKWNGCSQHEVSPACFGPAAMGSAAYACEEAG